MRKYVSIVIFGLFFVMSTGLGVCAGQRVVHLGPGQNLSLDLQLSENNTHSISMHMRTDMQNATVTIKLYALSINNEIIELGEEVFLLDRKDYWTEFSLEEIEVPEDSLHYAMVLSTDREGLYWWRDLKVFSDSEDSFSSWNQMGGLDDAFYTGLVIDARHLPLRKGITPKVYSNSGQLLYGGAIVSQAFLQEYGMVEYGEELNSELLARIEVDGPRPYSLPLIIKARELKDASQTGVIISETDTMRVLQALVRYDFFARYAVIFLIDEHFEERQSEPRFEFENEQDLPIEFEEQEEIYQ